MTWSVKSESIQPPVDRIDVDEVLYEYDGPLVFTANIGLAAYLFLKIDETETGEVFVAGQISSAKLARLKEGHLSIRGALGFDRLFPFELARDFTVRKFWRTDFENIGESNLPAKNVGLRPSDGWCADYMEQIESFFSIRISGGQLADRRVSLKQLRDFTSGFYNLVQHWITPSELSRKRDLVSYDAYEPAFGSLVFSIKRPSLNAQNLGDRNQIEIAQEINKRRDDLFSGINWLDSTDLGEGLSSSDRFEALSLIEGIDRFLPKEDGVFSSTEISFQIASEVKHIEIGTATAKRLKDSYNRLNEMAVTVTGRVEIVNSRSQTFVFKSSNSRSVTVEVDPVTFGRLISSGLQNEKSISVSGEYIKRTNRDKMIATDVSILD